MLTPLQQNVSELFARMEFEKSHLSAHEYREQCEQAELSKALEQGRSSSSPSATQETTLLTAHEQELGWQLEAEKFKPSDSKTEADVSNNMRTAWRQLDRPVFMLVKQTFGKEEPVWCLPSIPVEPGHNLRQVASKIIDGYLPTASKCRIFGNAPSAVHVYKYRDIETGERFGVQMYFYNAFVDRAWHGESMLTLPGITDFVWATTGELNTFITDRKLSKVLKSFIVEY
ncbi:39S ribosomal protein L46 mitochondrial [Paragonimus westermani]|uniref:39S ribosomal protein L46 mitochondrial n=1 Tax=Paragonimus westermani TaxID=34504 RepID=A0A8T0D4P1_9TREM|nr:39S ribosomal protein L46 mitochondrial [Paragonimus westermani]